MYLCIYVCMYLCTESDFMHFKADHTEICAIVQLHKTVTWDFEQTIKYT